MIQAAAIFLVGMAALAVVARFRKGQGRRTPPPPGRPGRLESPALCGRCGRMTDGRAPCPCETRRPDDRT